MAWSKVRDDLPLISKNVRGFVRVKPEGTRDFGPVRSLGRVSGGQRVSIGENGHTLLTWTQPDKRQAVMVRTPRRRWSKPQTLASRDRIGVTGAVGPDGTMLLVSTNVRHSQDSKAKIRVALTLPRQTKFEPWRTASRSGLQIGCY